MCVCVCLSVCLSVCLADILVFYFSAIRRAIDLKCIQDSNRVVLNSLKKTDLHRSKVKVTAKTIYGEDGTAIPFACNNFVVSTPCGAHGKQ